MFSCSTFVFKQDGLAAQILKAIRSQALVPRVHSAKEFLQISFFRTTLSAEKGDSRDRTGEFGERAGGGSIRSTEQATSNRPVELMGSFDTGTAGSGLLEHRTINLKSSV